MRRVYARSTTATVLPPEEAQAFIADHHRDGAIVAGDSSRFVGLKGTEGELLAVGHFCPPRTSGKSRAYSVEWARLAFARDVRVVGGASKLFKFFVAEYDPADVFTYQDTTGEVTNVYAECGMTQVSRARIKKYLLAPGADLESAGRKEKLGLPYALRYGPDRLLGTKLGAQPGKTNLELFLSLGWQVEETPGDAVWAWFSARTYYTYKITASDSQKYYYGMSHVKKNGATTAECAAHDYWGSGGTKFKNWKARHKKSLHRDVIKVFGARAPALAHEAKLIGSLHQTDPFCLNSKFGGSTTNNSFTLITWGECSKHGKTKVRSTACLRCAREEAHTLQECLIHGETTHQGDSCVKCYQSESYTQGACFLHGETTFHGKSCVACTRAASLSALECQKHGRATHSGSRCLKCAAEGRTREGDCPRHGKTAFYSAEGCIKCIRERSFSQQECPVHGLTAHNAGKCTRCLSDEARELGQCETHGEAVFAHGKCEQCRIEKAVTSELCGEHGVTAHWYGKCQKCSVGAQYFVKECRLHGETKHRGPSCLRCNGQSAQHSKGKHDELQSSACPRCVAAPENL